MWSAGREDLVDLEKQRMSHNVEMFGTKLIKGLDALKEDTRFLSKTPPIEGLVRAQANQGIDPLDGSTEQQWRERLTSIFTNIMEAKPYYLECRFIVSEGGGREWIRVDRLDKTSLASQDHLRKVGHEDFYQKTMRLVPGSLFLSEIKPAKPAKPAREDRVAQEPHTPLIHATTPIFRKDASFFGMIVISMDFSQRMTEVVDDLAGYEVMITNGEGQYLAHPMPGKAFGFEFGRPSSLQDEFPELEAWFNSGSVQNGFDTLIHKDRETVLYHHAFYESSKQKRRIMVLAVAQPLDKLAKTSNRVRDHGILISLAMILLILALTTPFTRIIIRPILQISDAASLMEQGDFRVTLPLKDRSEIGKLAQSLDSMARKIHQRTTELENSEAHNRAILDSSLDSIATINEKGIILSCNLSLERTLGYDSGEIVGKNVSMLMFSPELEDHDRYIHRYLRTGERHILGMGREVQVRHKSGKSLRMNLFISETKLDDQVIFTGFLRDISREETRRIREARLVELAERLGGEQEPASLGRNLLRYFAPIIKAPIAAFYVLVEDDHLRCVANQGVCGKLPDIAVGEGLVGQVADDKIKKQIQEIPSDYLNLQSGTICSKVGSILILPVMHEKDLRGVLELASLTPIEPENVTLLEAAMPAIGTSLNAALSRQAMRQLLFNSITGQSKIS